MALPWEVHTPATADRTVWGGLPSDPSVRMSHPDWFAQNAPPAATPSASAPAGATQAGAPFYQPNTTGALSLPYESEWATPFQAPTGATEQNDPGYAFRLNQGLQSEQRLAAAKGTLLTGGTLKDLQRYAQDYASGEYGNVYGRALGEYQQGMNTFLTNQGNTYQRLLGVANLGQNAATSTGNQGLGYANLGAQTITGAGNAGAAGSVGVGNAITGGIQSGTNTLSQLALLNQQQQRQQQSGSSYAYQGPSPQQ